MAQFTLRIDARQVAPAYLEHTVILKTKSQVNGCQSLVDQWWKDLIMTKDYELWNIDELLKAYVNVPDMAETLNVTMEQLFLFLEKHALLTCTVSNAQGQVIKRSIRRSELNEEGLKLGSGPKNAVHRWLGSKAAQKSPPDMKLLENTLAEIRSGQ